MSLSNTSRTVIEEATTHVKDGASARTVFNIPRMAIGFMALGGVGLYATGATGAGYQYPPIGGIDNLIRKIMFQSGESVIISQLDRFTRNVVTYHNLKSSNQTAEDLTRVVSLSSYYYQPNDQVGYYDASGVDYDNAELRSLSTMPMGTDYLNDYTDASGNGRQVQNNGVLLTAESAEEGPSGKINLAKFLGVLASMPMINHLPDAKLTIFWNNSSTDLYLNDNATGGVTSRWSVKRPYLIIEEQLGVSAPSLEAPSITPYSEMEVERFPLKSTGSAETESFRLRAFVGRYIENLVVWIRPSGDSEWLNRENICQDLENMEVQLRIDNINYLPSNGAVHAGEDAYYTLQSGGDLLTPYVSHLNGGLRVKTDASLNIMDSETEIVRAKLAVRVYKLGFRIKEEAMITLKHTNNASADLLVFGDPTKVLTIMGDKARVEFA